MGIAENIYNLRKEIPPHVRLVAVSKTMPAEAIMEAYQAGQKAFGENRVQEILAKKPLLPPDIEWHHIGHLQTNKIKSLIPHTHLIQGVDSDKLLAEISRESSRSGIASHVLLQVKIAREETKFGLNPDDLHHLVHQVLLGTYPGVVLRGLMGMASFTSDDEIVRQEFEWLSRLFNGIRNQFGNSFPHFTELSMGMSGDYRLAIAAGSTLVRIGSLIFGERRISH